MGFSKNKSLIGFSISIFIDINLKVLINTDDEKLIYWNLGVYFGLPIHF